MRKQASKCARVFVDGWVFVCEFITLHALHSIIMCSSQCLLFSTTSYSLNVIPMDLFCLSSVSCRVIDYGQFSKYPTANTSSTLYLSLLRFGQCVCFQTASANVCFSLQSKLCTLFRLPFRYLCISASIRWATLFHCFPMFFSHSRAQVLLKIQFNWFCWLYSQRAIEVFAIVRLSNFSTIHFHVGSFLFFTLTHCDAAIYPNTSTN